MRIKQKLQSELKNTPANAPQVCRSVTSRLNKDESPSAALGVLGCNNAEVDQPESRPGQHRKVTDKQTAYVFVLDSAGKPLMP